MRKKLTLLAMAVGALVAFAAPSMASAQEWYTNGVKLGTSKATGDAVHFTGTLSLTKFPVKVSCNATANTVLWNQGGVATGEVSSLTYTADPVGTAGCTVAVFTGSGYVDIPCHANMSSKDFPWPSTASGLNVVIHKANFTNEFVGAGCLAALGIPSGTRVEDKGTAEGAVVGEKIVFNESGTFAGGSKIDGELTPTNAPKLELK